MKYHITLYYKWMMEVIKIGTVLVPTNAETIAVILFTPLMQHATGKSYDNSIFIWKEFGLTVC